jgi:hypothetical protein
LEFNSLAEVAGSLAPGKRGIPAKAFVWVHGPLARI